MNWYVVYTKPKAEKKVAEAMERVGIENYCPTVKEVRQWSDRKKELIVPLFTSYVFVRLKEGERSKVFDIPGVVRYLFFLGKPAVVRDAEIEVIQKWLNNDDFSEFEIGYFQPGDEVIISNQTFKEQEAVIKEVGKKRLRLVLHSLGCTVNVKINDVQKKY